MFITSMFVGVYNLPPDFFLNIVYRIIMSALVRFRLKLFILITDHTHRQICKYFVNEFISVFELSFAYLFGCQLDILYTHWQLVYHVLRFHRFRVVDLLCFEVQQISLNATFLFVAILLCEIFCSWFGRLNLVSQNCNAHLNLSLAWVQIEFSISNLAIFLLEFGRQFI